MYSIIAQFKALIERILEWGYFIDLDKLFQRYFILVLKKEEFCEQELKRNYIVGMAPKTEFWMVLWLY